MERGGTDPSQHLKDMALDGVAGEVLYPSQGSFTSRLRTQPDVGDLWRVQRLDHQLCRTDPDRLKGIEMINLDDVEDGMEGVERAARLNLAAR